MDYITEENLRTYWHLWVLGSIIFGLIVFFIIKFLLPSFRLSGELQRAISKLKDIKGDGQAINVELIGKDIMTSSKLAHCWSEFEESLHPQTGPDEFGQERVVRWRSTVPAESIFNVETLIGVELKTEYFKHQPGILTGIGILGTFIGLLRGLSNFSVSSDPEKVRLSLDHLILGVREAFYMSAIAIGLAMFTTLLEKLCISGRIKQVEELCQELDKLFEGGAGEEYLARLVNAGESSATQTAQLKDALVTDLKEMLAEMIKQQTDSIAASFAASSHAQVQTTEQSGDRIANAITDSLSDPLQKIAAAVNTTTDTNGQVVTKALNEVLVTFSAKLEDSFGGQMGAINQLLQQTTSAMQSTVARFDQLANNLDDAGKNAADAMSERLSVALESMESRQLALNKTMTDFVTQLRDMMQSSQSETSAHIQSTLALLGEQVAAMTEQLQSQASSAAESHQEQQNKLLQSASAIQQNISEQSSHLIEQLTEQVQAMLGQTTNVVSSMQTAVATMRDVTKDNTQRMEASAGTLALSAENFAKAGDSVAGVMQQTGSVSDKIATTSVALNTAAVTVQNALADYNNAGKTLSEMVAALKSTVEIAKLDASVSQGLVNQIKQSADNLQQAQSSVDGIFKEICEELANAHEVFTGNLTKAIKSSNTDYQKQLKDAVDILKTAIAELGDVVETIPARR
jgi:hypothetical protein